MKTATVNPHPNWGGLSPPAQFSLEQDLAAALEELVYCKRVMRALDHRTKNAFQMAAGLLRLQGEGMQDDDAREALRHAARRLTTIASAYGIPGEDDLPSTISLTGYLQRMCTGFDKGGGVTPSVRLQQELAELECRTEVAVPLGLIANEALTNAFQHGFVDGRRGRVRLRLRRIDERFLSLCIADNGVGRSVAAADGLGTRLMRELAKQVAGELTICSGASGGCTVTVMFPQTLLL